MTVMLTITDKGQITLKKEVLAHLGARPGDKVDVDLLPGGEVKVRRPAGRPISSIFGMLHEPDLPPMTVEEINAAAAAGWAAER